MTLAALAALATGAVALTGWYQRTDPGTTYSAADRAHITRTLAQQPRNH